MNDFQFDPGVTGLTFRNHTGDTIAPWAVFAIEEIEWDANGYYTCHAVLIDATTVGGTNQFALNGGVDVPDGKTGRCFLAMHQPAWALVDPYLVDTDVAASGGNYVEVGPESGKDYLTTSGTGFLVVGGKFNTGMPTGGRLLVIQRVGRSSTTSRIRFTILSTAFSEVLGAIGCDFVNARVNWISCNSTGVSIGDEVRIFDPELCHFNLPIDLLVGLCGTATSMDSAEFIASRYYIPDCLYIIDGQSCIWMVDTLCCAEEQEIAP